MRSLRPGLRFLVALLAGPALAAGGCFYQTEVPADVLDVRLTYDGVRYEVEVEFPRILVELGEPPQRVDGAIVRGEAPIVALQRSASEPANRVYTFELDEGEGGVDAPDAVCTVSANDLGHVVGCARCARSCSILVEDRSP